MMKRRTLLIAPLLLAPFLLAPVASRAQVRAVVLSAQDKADIVRIETTLNATRALHAKFFQVAPDGGTSTGQVWLVRPGRMRFEYDPPAPFLLVAGHGLLVFNDRQLKQTTNIPLDSTPLGLLLQDNVKLSGDVSVVSFIRQPGQIQVGVVRSKSPGDGVLTLTFADTPLALRQWAVLDQQRNETQVTLSAVTFGGNYPDRLFEFVDPKFFQNNPGSGG